MFEILSLIVFFDLSACTLAHLDTILISTSKLVDFRTCRLFWENIWYKFNLNEKDFTLSLAFYVYLIYILSNWRKP